MERSRQFISWCTCIYTLLLATTIPTDSAASVCTTAIPGRGRKISQVTPSDINGGSNLGSDVKLEMKDGKVTMDNGIIQVTLTNPQGMIAAVQLNGGENLLEIHFDEESRGYWDLEWSKAEHEHNGLHEDILGTKFSVIKKDPDQVEVSFTKDWKSSDKDKVPLKIDIRYIMLRGSSGFYSYAIYEHLKGWPNFQLAEARIVCKLNKDKFHYMAVTDERQRIMPMYEDRNKGEALAYPEAVLLTNPAEPKFKGEVDDKYQYACEAEDYGVHGWISDDPSVGFWMITPSNEFRNGGPQKQDLTCHTGPIILSMFNSLHFAGDDAQVTFKEGEPWTKVLGPVFIYVNSLSRKDQDPYTTLWQDAKQQMEIEKKNWPYSFPASPDFAHADQRGKVSSTLLVRDRVGNGDCNPGDSAYVGLAPLGDVGSWQTEGKGYQFWTKVMPDGSFSITNVREGKYNLYAYVLGFIGDYKYNDIITITAGCDIKLGDIIFEPPRDGPTLWEIGVPDRSPAEFFIPDPNPEYANKLSDLKNLSPVNKLRQYGLWERYAELYPDKDLVYTVNKSDYQRDWFYAQVVRKVGEKKYEGTTWQVVFDLQNVDPVGTYKLRITLAAVQASHLQVRVNDPQAARPVFDTGMIGRDNAIARHGIYGLYQLITANIPASLLKQGQNTIYLSQLKNDSPFTGIMYDYLRLEGPSTPAQTV